MNRQDKIQLAKECAERHFLVDDLCKRDRHTKYNYARFIYAYFLRYVFGLRFEDIAKEMKRDHATIAYYLDVIDVALKARGQSDLKKHFDVVVYMYLAIAGDEDRERFIGYTGLG